MWEDKGVCLRGGGQGGVSMTRGGGHTGHGQDYMLGISQNHCPRWFKDQINVFFTKLQTTTKSIYIRKREKR